MCLGVYMYESVYVCTRAKILIYIHIDSIENMKILPLDRD